MLALLAAAPLAAAERSPLVEISVGERKLTGTVIAHDQQSCRFLERDGRLSQIDLQDVADYRVLGAFRPFTALELRERLTREFPGSSVIATGHYVVAAPPGDAQRLAGLFEELYRQFVVVFGARGFRMREPEFPLVAVVFPDAAAFESYCRQEGVRPQPGLRGYYLTTSNRVALFDTTSSGLTDGAGLDGTIIHEATHQVAFNTGIHSRQGGDPKWVVEGLATVFEREAVRLNSPGTPALARINPQRFSWFGQYAHSGRRGANALSALVESDAPFDAQPLDAYSEAWMLSFYLLETRSADYTSYLQRLARRDHEQPYSAADRRRDFEAAFGRNLGLLDAQLLRYRQQLEASTGE